MPSYYFLSSASNLFLLLLASEEIYRNAAIAKLYTLYLDPNNQYHLFSSEWLKPGRRFDWNLWLVNWSRMLERQSSYKKLFYGHVEQLQVMFPP